MSIRNLSHFFTPDSVALVGASARTGSVGATVLANLVSGGFAGPVWPVRDMISRTRVARLLAGFRDTPPADLDALCDVLVQVGQMAADLPELCELDINPLLAFILTRPTPDGYETLGVARVVADPDNIAGEFAIVVRSDLHGRGLREITGIALADNLGMHALAHHNGFSVAADADGTVALRRMLDPRDPHEAP
jgi:hypothetical protein